MLHIVPSVRQLHRLPHSLVQDAASVEGKPNLASCISRWVSRCLVIDVNRLILQLVVISQCWIDLRTALLRRLRLLIRNFRLLRLLWMKIRLCHGIFGSLSHVLMPSLSCSLGWPYLVSELSSWLPYLCTAFPYCRTCNHP